MSKVRKTMKLIEKTKGYINAEYDMSAKNITDIYEASKDKYELIYNGFRFGYIQGVKAARSENGVV